MSDAIEISGLRVLGVHGVLAEEQERAQPFEIDLRIEVDLRPAAHSDHLDDALDYGVVADAVASIVATTHYFLIETLAQAIADEVLSDARVTSVDVTVRKLHPPLALDLTSVGVAISRARAR